ncbi:hypothetical protein FHL15_009314 [Xylaria flabelliformis]|uniref:DUF7896 domain-containing protein n=1 Tax=Xylaria flabelliformis TaxID=2512241 RepID=A0A553HP42_9PEZI|nr:hypothetical protein FHL15_009314 [Xylaria flabelliformis]
MEISTSPVRAYLEAADEDGNVISEAESQYDRPPGASTRSPMMGVHTILNPAQQDRTQPASLLKHVTISRDNTANKNERESASFAYLGSRLRSYHNTSSKVKTIRRTSPLRTGLGTLSTSSLETPTGEHRKGFSGEHKPPSDNKNDDKAGSSQTRFIRPIQPRVFCDQCDKHKEGFRGEHELRRHKDAMHQTHVKKFICIDPRKYGLPHDTRVVNPLSNCKSCKAQKKYGAYYNAAAHLRRNHFRERLPPGRKNSGANGGNGSENWPPLKEMMNWMKEIWVLQDE